MISHMDSNCNAQHNSYLSTFGTTLGSLCTCNVVYSIVAERIVMAKGWQIQFAYILSTTFNGKKWMVWEWVTGLNEDNNRIVMTLEYMYVWGKIWNHQENGNKIQHKMEHKKCDSLFLLCLFILLSGLFFHPILLNEIIPLSFAFLWIHNQICFEWWKDTKM